MKLAILILCLVASGASAREIIKYPTSDTFEWSIRTVGDVTAHAVGLVECSVSVPTFESLAHFEGIPEPAPGKVVSGVTTLVVADGDKCFRGVSIGAAGGISAVSADNFSIRIVPDAPVLLPGAGDVVVDDGGAGDVGGAEE